MTEETKDIWAAIAERQEHYKGIIEKANATIESARALIKEARAGLDALPVAKVRRAKKVKTEEAGGIPLEWESGDEGLEDVRGKP